LTDKIQLIRLITGEDIVSEARIAENGVTLTNPIIVVAMPGPSGHPPNIGFAPWMPYSKDRKFLIADKNIITMTEPLPQFVQQYTEINSKIALPSKGLILPGK
jgi:hypothetical protein